MRSLRLSRESLRVVATVQQRGSRLREFKFHKQVMAPPQIPARFIRSVTPAQISDYPALAALLTLWERKRRGRLAPQRRDFTAEDLHLWFGNLMVIDVVEGGADFRYRVYGTDVATAYGHDMTNRLASEFPSPVAEFVLSNYREIVTDRRPMFCEHTPPIDVSVYSWQRLILPLSEDGETVSQILVAIYPSQARRAAPALSRGLLP